MEFIFGAVVGGAVVWFLKDKIKSWLKPASDDFTGGNV